MVIDTDKYKVLGAKAGAKPSTPNIADDTVASLSLAKILYGLGEGEISGIVGGAKGIKLNDTPLQDDNGNDNFENVTYDFRSGTLEQEYIKGFPDVSNEIGVGVELKGTAWIKAINKPELSAVRIRLSWNSLKEQVLKSGDVKGYKIEYAIDVKTGSGSYVEVLNTFINDKVSGKYERTHRIDLPESSNGWQIRVRRITPNATSDLIQDKMFIESITEVIDIKLRYPNTALLGLQYDAKTFSSIAKIAVRAKGKIISIPTNYNTETGLYSGIWNGTFKQAYSNNPAWVFYDIVTASRYGLGKRIDKSMMDKWALYSLGVYCDELIDDGEGGLEKRYTCNVYIQSQSDAFSILQQLAGIFKAITYWNGEQIVLDADVPQDAVYTFSRSNVIDGIFEYTGTRLKDRHTVAKIAFDNPNESYKTEYEYIRDEAGIAKFGINIVDISAIGCTSRAQAQRAGLWALKSEQLETRTVSFSTGLEGFIPQVGNIIEISDELLAGRANGGRIAKVQSKVITLDRSLPVKVNDILVVNGSDGKSEKRKVTNVNNKVITIVSAFENVVEGAVFAIRSEDLNTMLFRVMSIKPDDDSKFNISAIQHEPLKYDAIDFGADVKPTNISNVVPPNTIAAPDSIALSATYRVVQGQTVATLVIQWSQIKDAVSYAVEWRKDNGNWISAGNTGNVSIEVEGVYAGNYLARVVAISAFGISSAATTSVLTAVQGKVGAPNSLSSIKAEGLLFGMALSWTFKEGSEDTNYTEIETATNASGANGKVLGSFSYPTNKTELTGLQGGLKVYYRGRIVDKLGNVSAWSNWVSGTTSADAALVLELLEGQITESQLFTDLGTKINQIDINKSAIEDIDFTEVNAGIAQAEADIAQAKTDITAAQAKADAAKLLADANKIDLVAVNTVVGNNKTSVDQSITTLTNKDTTLTNLYTALNSEYGTNKAKVVADLKTLTDKDISLSSLLTNLTSAYDTNKASVSQSLTTLTNKDTSLTNSLTSLTTTVGNNSTAITNEATTRSSADSALSTRITTAQSKADTNAGKITTAETTLATHTQAIAKTESQLEASYKTASYGKNLFIQQGVIDNVGYLLTGSGGIGDSSAHRYSDYIPVIGNTYYVYHTREGALRYPRIVAYDSNKNYITGESLWVGSNLEVTSRGWTTPSNAAFIRVSADHFNGASLDKWKVEVDKVTPYSMSDIDSNANISTLNLSTASNTQAIAQVKTDISAKYDIQDTRSVDSPPSYYYDNYPKATAKEFKYRATMNVSGSGSYVYLETLVKWSSVSGGTVTQTVITDDSRTYIRQSVGTTSWSVWAEQETAAGAAAKVAAAKAELDGRINSTNANVSSLTTTVASNTQAIATAKTTLTADFKNYTDSKTKAISVGTDAVKLINPVSYSTNNSTNTGYLIIETPITPSRMCNVSLSGYNYLGDESTIDLDIGFYNTTSRFYNYDYTSKGSFEISKVQAAWNGADKKAVLIIGLSNTVWRYPKITVDSALIGYNSSDDSLASGWSMRINTDISSYTELTEFTGTDIQGKLTVNSAAIQTESVARANAVSALASTVTKLETKTTNSTALNHFDMRTDYNNWTNYIGDGETSTSSTHNSVIIGNNSGNDQQWLIRNENIPLLSGVIYRVTARYWNRYGTGRTYIGVAGVAANGTDFVRASDGSNSYSGQTYIGSDATASSFVEMTGFIAAEGTDTKGLANVNLLHANSKYFRPLILANYNNTSGTTYIDYYKVEVVDSVSTALVEDSKKSIDGLSAQTTLKLDVNGYVSGMGQYNNGTTSQFAVRADNFYIANPSSKTASVPFQVNTSTTTVNGVSVPAGTYIKDAYISNGSISNAKIGNAAITTAKIGNLAVDTAQIATGAIENAKIANAAITSAKIGDAQVDSLQIKGEAVTVPRAVSSVLTQVTDNQDSVELEIFRTTLDSGGAAVIINFGFTSLSVEAQSYANPKAEIKIYRDSTIIHEMILNPNTTGSNTNGNPKGMYYSYLNIPSVIDNPPTGNRVYKVTLKSYGLKSNDMFLRGSALTLFGAKR